MGHKENERERVKKESIGMLWKKVSLFEFVCLRERERVRERESEECVCAC